MWRKPQVARLMAVLPCPFQVAFTPYAPEPGSSCQPREYYVKQIQMCCSMCPPGKGQSLGCWVPVGDALEGMCVRALGGMVIAFDSS